MNWIDIGILVIVAVFTVLSLSSGFIRELVGIVGFVLAVVLAGRFYPLISGQLGFLGPATETVGPIIGFLVIFALVSIAASLLGTVLANSVGLLLGSYDGLAGAIFGAIKGLLFCQILIILLLRFPVFDLRGAISESFIGRVMASQAPLLLNLLPGDFDAVRRALVP